MSQHDGTNITSISASDDTDIDPRGARRQRKLERRRDRHNTRATLHRTAQYPIRRLLASV